MVVEGLRRKDVGGGEARRVGGKRSRWAYAGEGRALAGENCVKC